MDFLSERLFCCSADPNYGSRCLKANRFRSQDAHGASVCHARSRRIACGVRLQSHRGLRKSRGRRGHAAAGAGCKSCRCKSCRLTVQRLVLRWMRSTKASAATSVFRRGDFGSRSRRLTCASQKNNNPDQLIPGLRGDLSWCTAPTSPAVSGAAWDR